MIEIGPTSENKMSYDNAVLYCQFCNHNGHKDWRLPTLDEYNNYLDICGWYKGGDPSRWLNYPNYPDGRVTPVRDI